MLPLMLLILSLIKGSIVALIRTIRKQGVKIRVLILLVWGDTTTASAVIQVARRSSIARIATTSSTVVVTMEAIDFVAIGIIPQATIGNWHEAITTR